MNLRDLVTQGWDANPIVIGGLAIAALLYGRYVGRRGKPALFVVAIVLLALAFLSPLNPLATGILFSAHMAQHLILLLLVPGLVLLSLPEGLRLGGRKADDAGRGPSRATGTGSRAVQFSAVVGWCLGVGSMWFWHVPVFCDAAASNGAVHALQTASLLGLGAAFWWPILSPLPAQRLIPGHGIAYLFSACLACTGLGILLTLSSVEVCAVFAEPVVTSSPWASLRSQFSPQRDQQIGGLLMWMPMCLVYVAAIVLELARWLGDSRPSQTTATLRP